MTSDTHSGAHGAPETDEPERSFPFQSDERPSFGTFDSPAVPAFERQRAADEPPASGAGSTEGGDPAAKPRRRRGSRGGRRRRTARDDGADGATATADGDAPSADSASEEALAPDVDDDAPFEASIDASSEPALDPAADETPGVSRRRGRRSRRGRRRGGRSADSAAAEVTPEDGAVEPPIPDEDDEPPIPVRGPARGSVRSPARAVVPRELDEVEPEGSDDGTPADDDREQAGEATALDGNGRKKRRRRGSRGGRRRRRADGTEVPADDVAAESNEPARIDLIPGEDDDFPEHVAAPAPSPAPEAKRSRRRRRGQKAGDAEPVENVDDEPRAIPESQRNAMLLVNATDPEEQRVAVLEGGQIADFQMTVKDQDSLVNDIYRGRVVNLEPAIGAAFIDFGQGRNGFLHTSDVLSCYGDDGFGLDKLLTTKIDPDEWDGGSSQPSVSAEFDDEKEKKSKPKDGGKRRFRARPRLPITDLLKKGQMVVVQVTKDAIGDKGPTLTTYISIPGRYLVLMPSMARTGVSRKIEDEKERKRLKRILQSLDVPAGMGVIVRTAGVGHSKAEIKRDLDYLKGAWEAFGKKLVHGHGPAPLYRESDVAIRTLRDLFTPQTKAVIVDDPEVHRHLVDFATQLMPEDVGRLQLHDGSKPLFASYGIEQDFEKIFSRRIELPSGGSIVFDQAEALVAIDVNSGRTRSEGFDFEAIALKTNLEAVPEIARQIRLRDLGGIIVVDFIDMMKMGNIRAVERAFKDALAQDRARSKIGRISQFGLLELTRQRLGPGMSKKVFHTCSRCRGTGRIRTVNSRAAAILRRLGSALTLKGFTAVEVKAHPEVVEYLDSSCSEYLRALEYRFQREIKVLPAPEQVEDSVLRYLRADGREVRPGGRRKR